MSQGAARRRSGTGGALGTGRQHGGVGEVKGHDEPSHAQLIAEQPRLPCVWDRVCTRVSQKGTVTNQEPVSGSRNGRRAGVSCNGLASPDCLITSVADGRRPARRPDLMIKTNVICSHRRDDPTTCSVADESARDLESGLGVDLRGGLRPGP
jgi:hypothetical protein